MLLQEAEKHKSVAMAFDARIANREQALLQEKVSLIPPGTTKPDDTNWLIVSCLVITDSFVVQE
jgi:hypothetical protein